MIYFILDVMMQRVTLSSQNQSLVKQKSVIIIDDDEDTPRLFAELLEECGIKVLAQGYDGKSAIALYKKYSPDVVLLDMMMPNGSGIYAIKGIRKINPDAKIILVTADLKSLTGEKMKQFNVPIIYKPFDIDMVISHIINS